ncbi:MAG: hypothetical protein MHM6MM_006697 [Cercozoa sp. M6MM]
MDGILARTTMTRRRREIDERVAARRGGAEVLGILPSPPSTERTQKTKEEIKQNHRSNKKVPTILDFVYLLQYAQQAVKLRFSKLNHLIPSSSNQKRQIRQAKFTDEAH